MKVYNSITIDMETDEVIEEDSYEYEGPVAQCIAPAVLAAIISAAGGLAATGISMANQPKPMSTAEQKSMGQSNMPDPVPMQGQEDIDWEKLFAMLAQQSTPPLYDIMPQLYQGIPMGQQQQGMGGQ